MEASKKPDSSHAREARSKRKLILYTKGLSCGRHQKKLNQALKVPHGCSSFLEALRIASGYRRIPLSNISNTLYHSHVESVSNGRRVQHKGSAPNRTKYLAPLLPKVASDFGSPISSSSPPGTYGFSQNVNVPVRSSSSRGSRTDLDCPTDGNDYSLGNHSVDKRDSSYGGFKRRKVSTSKKVTYLQDKQNSRVPLDTAPYSPHSPNSPMVRRSPLSNINSNITSASSLAECRTRRKSITKKSSIFTAKVINVRPFPLQGFGSPESIESPPFEQVASSQARQRRREILLGKQVQSPNFRQLNLNNERLVSSIIGSNNPPMSTNDSNEEFSPNASENENSDADRCESEAEVSDSDSLEVAVLPENITTLLQCAEDTDLVDLGDPICYCFYRKARMWPNEKSGNIKSTRDAAFSLCCLKGKVELPNLPKPPSFLLDLMADKDPRSKHFKENIRAYNSMFAFTSMGGKVLTSVNNGGGPPQFILGGQNFHRIGSLTPQVGQPPKFAQLYIYDTQNENFNRAKHFSSMVNGDGLDISLVEDLKQMVDRNNVLAIFFRRVRDYLNSNENAQLSVRLFRARGKDPRTYNLPTADDVAALIVGDIHDMQFGRDVIVKMNEDS